MDPVQLHGGIGPTGSGGHVDMGGALTFPLGSGTFLDVGAHAGTTVFNGQHSNHAVGGISNANNVPAEDVFKSLFIRLPTPHKL